MTNITYDVKFQFQEYYFWVNEVSDLELERILSIFERKATITVTSGRSTYTVNSDMIVYIEHHEHLPF